MDGCELRFPIYNPEPIFPSLITLLWSSTNAKFRRNRLQRTQSLQRYGIKKLLRISRKEDKPHVFKYISTMELKTYIKKKNKQTINTRIELSKIGIRKNIPLDIIKHISQNYLYIIK